MSTDLQAAPRRSQTLDADALDALRRLALHCAAAADADGVLHALRGGLSALDGAAGLEIAGLPAQSTPLQDFACAAAEECARSSAAVDVFARAVAIPMRVLGEPAALALGWEEDTTSAERALALAEALAEQTAVALEAAARLAEARDAALRRDRIFSAMSHDLRTPITAIVGYSELLQDGIVGELSERQQEMVGRICQVSGELAQLVTDMLDLAKLDAGRMEFLRETVTLAEVVEAGVDAAEAAVEATGARVEVVPASGAHAPLRLDRARVRQVLSNLVSHGARAAPGGVVEVATGADGDGVWVEIADGGPPIDDSGAETLFEAAPRGASRVGRVGPGAALSLALSRRIARAMGGELAAAPRPGGGLVLTLTLPAA